MSTKNLEERPTSVRYYPDGKTASIMEWRRKGLLHRENGKPASIAFWENGNVQLERFFENGVSHRDGGLPTTVTYYEDGAVELEFWENSSLSSYSRDNDLPAIIGYDPDGSVVRKEWCLEGKPYREGGKPEIEIYKNGKLVEIVKGGIVTEVSAA